ncbi:fimbrillin family protein [Elizabethkingia sp. YR214]|uniref:fimbrillin family protein n=1 Tax=Elizabethkingia sp. YR214 TaxID=2135667 RepID=UPI000D2FAF81|nr:fimbrillin family protein [Elizabethkingia sp. YR214]
MKNIKITTAMAMLSLSFFAVSCRSADSAVDNNGGNEMVNGSALLKFNLTGEDYEGKDIEPLASTKNVISVEKEQVRNLIVGDQAFIVTMTPVSKESTAQASVNPIAAGGIKLVQGVVFRVVVYRGDAYIGQKLYTINASGGSVPTTGTSSTNTDMMLDGDTESLNKYTFVVYSFNSSVDPGAAPTTNLSATSLSGVSGNSDLMYFRADNIRVSKGDNLLSVLFKHKFSQITTIIDASDVSPGNGIQSINTPVMSNHRATGNVMKFSDGTVTFGAAGIGKALSFSGNSTSNAVWTSAPLLFANPGAATSDMATLTISSMQVGAKTKNAISIPNIVAKPGYKYNLKLKFACTAVATPTWPFSMSDTDPGNAGKTVITKTFDNAPAADAGFVFDVYKMDNSFNLNINGVNLSNQEIQFQSAVAAYPRNIRFKSDGGMWELNGIPAIYNIDGTATSTPIVRITIGPDGSVSMMGRRSLGSALEPLELFNGALFNVINWKKTEPNAVMATMVVTGTTVMNGLGVGRKVVPCP